MDYNTIFFRISKFSSRVSLNIVFKIKSVADIPKENGDAYLGVLFFFLGLSNSWICLSKFSTTLLPGRCPLLISFFFSSRLMKRSSFLVLQPFSLRRRSNMMSRLYTDIFSPFFVSVWVNGCADRSSSILL